MKPLKSVFRISIAFFLLFSLTVSALAVQPPDFFALAEKGNQDTVPGVIVTTPPKFYVSEIRSFCGKYTSYRDAGTGKFGITDYLGNTYFQATGQIYDMTEISDSGLVGVATERGWQPFNIYGKRLCDEQYFSYELFVVPDWATGSNRYMAGELRSKDSPAPVGGMIVDVYGHQMVAEDTSVVYDGKMAYKQNGKWGLCKLFGETLLPCTYDYLRLVAKDILLAEKDGVYSLIDPAGKQLLALDMYEDVKSDMPSYERILVKKNGKWGVLDLKGNQILPCIYTELSYPSTDADYYGKIDGVWHCLTESGTDIPYGDNQWDGGIQKISQDIYLSNIKNHGRTLTDHLGNPLIPDWYTFDRVENGFVMLATSSDTRPPVYDGSVFNENAEKVLDFSGVSNFGATKDRVVLYKNNTVEFYDAEGVLQQTLENIDSLWIIDWYCVVQRGGKYAMTNSVGKLVTGFDYSDVSYVDESLLQMEKAGKWYLMNGAGTQVLEYPLEAMGSFDRDHGTDDLYSYYKTNGAVGFMKYRGTDDPAFWDVDKNAWYAKNVDFCEKAGLMNGVGCGSFAPTQTMTRAMLVQVLYNLSGEKNAPYGFTDVPSNAWYYDAVNWAAANGIVNGVGDGKFSPNAPVTREQTVTILRRFALNFSEAPFNEEALDGFSDASLVSAFARDSMCWAVQIGLINGRTPTTLAPNGQTTRAEIAALLQRFVLQYAS